nr:MAG TPA: Neck appendage protein [Caudoviricetes sp.]
MQINFNTTRLDILPTDESYRYRSIMGEHTLTLYFSLPTYTDIPTGAWCEFQGERYTLNQPAKVVKHNTHHFEYTLTMDSEGANLRNYKLRNPNDKTLKFPFTASPRYHIQILVDCLNMIDSGWQVGTTIEASEKLVSYNHNNCLEALDMIAKAFETEYEIIGKSIHLRKVEYFKNNPLPLQYGKGKGFKTGVSRTTEQSRITRLYVQGGERNIDRSKYGNKELLLPKSQEYTYEGITFASDDKGLSITIKNAQNNSFINEQSLDLSHIYPKRKGTISAVFEVDKAKHFYDFTDTTIPQALNFWNMRINGEKMVIYFESGMLSGREFEVNHYDHAQKRFQLQPKEEDGATMPNDIFKPAVGDQYSVYNMQMPNAYICDNATQSGASWEMMKEACKYLYENRSDHFTFTGDLDGIWAKKHWANVGGRLKMGAYIHFSDTEFQRTPVAIRIVGLKEYVNNPYSPQIELSNKVQGQSFATEIRKLQNQEVYFEELNKRTQSLTKRSWRDAQETIKQIEEAFPEYTKSIVPVTVQTMMALIGNKSTQFDFVVSKTNPIKSPHTLYFDKNTKQINAGSGWLKHFTLGSSDITPNRDANSYKYWNIPAFVSGRLDDKTKTYYLYIKASKTIETGEFILSENKIDIEQEAGFYHFLYATVNSEYENERGIAKLNGFTEITGGQIKTDKITSGNGQQYIELLPNEIRIKANLHITDGNKTEIKQLVNPDLLSLETKLKQYTNDTNSTLESKLKEYTNKGEIYLRGTGLNRHASPIIQINGQNVVPDNYRGLYLVVIRRSDLQVIFKQNYDTFANDFDDSNKLADYLNGLNSDVLVALVSRDSFTQGNNNGKKIVNALIRCGANDDNSKFVSRMPYAFLGIPNISKGNGIEVYTSDAGNAPYAEIATKIINGTPQGMNSAVNGMLQAEQQVRTQAINEANANINAKFLESKTFAEQKVNELQVGGRNLILNTTSGQVIYQPPLTKLFLSSQLEIGEQYTISWKGKLIDNHLDNWVAVQRLNAWEHSPNEVMIRERINSIEEKKYSFTFTAKNSSERPEIGIWIWGKVSIGSLKLERGNKATDWTPAPEDLEAQIQTERQSREQAIATAKTATEAYARTQSELTKAQAIAEANKQAGIAITAEQQTRILQLQQNLQQAKTFAEQKVNELNIGGKNLLRETKEFIVNGQPNHMDFSWSRKAGILISERFNGNVVRKINGDWQGVKANMPDIIGEPITISFWAKTNGTGRFGNYANKNKNPNAIEQFSKYSNDGVLINDNQWHRYTIFNPKGMCLGEGTANGFIEFYNVSGDIFYSSIKLERGNKPTDWSPAPEDIENKVADIQTDLQNAINNAKALVDVEKNNRLLTDKRVKAIEDLAEPENGKETAFSKGIKSLQTKTSPFSDTLIDGNVVATGTMIVGNTMGTQAGISGVGIADNDVRFWAGSNYKERSKAPFYVLQDGTLHATNANISGHIDAESGQIKGDLELLGRLYAGAAVWDRKKNIVRGGTCYDGSGMIYRDDPQGVQATFGSISGSIFGASAALSKIARTPKRPKSDTDISTFTGQIISVPPHPNDEMDTFSGSFRNNRAQIIYGDTAFLGANAHFEYGYRGEAFADVISRWIGTTTTFNFTSVRSGYSVVRLPSSIEIQNTLQKIGMPYFERNGLSLSFNILITMTGWVGGGRIILKGQPNGLIVDGSDNVWGGEQGNFNMSKGNSVLLNYFAGVYRIISRQE